MLLSFAQNHFNCFLTTWEFRVPLSISVNVHPFFLQRQHEFQSSPRFHIQVVLHSSSISSIVRFFERWCLVVHTPIVMMLFSYPCSDDDSLYQKDVR